MTATLRPPFGRVDPRRHRLRPDRRRRACRGPGAGRAAGGGPGLLHPPVRRARARGLAAGAPGRLGCALPRRRAGSIKTVRRSLVDAHAVGDLAALPARLQALTGDRRGQRAAARAERARQSERVRRPRRRSPSPRPRRWPPATTGGAGSTASGRCSTTGRRSPGSTGPPTTRCGTASPPRGRPTPGAARPSSPSRTGSARAARRSRSSWSPRPRRSRPPPTGGRRPARTAT